MDKNSVFINEHGVVEIIVNGDQTVDSVQVMGDRAFELLHELRSAGKPALLLDNLFFIGTVPVEARKRVVELVQSGEYERFAMVGKGTAIRLGSNLLLQATGRGKHVRYFDDYAKALDWLKRK